jgi:hypothetical protein
MIALYDARAAQLLESLAATGFLAPRGIAGHHRCATPTPPPDLIPAWSDVDTPEEWERLRKRET